MSEQPDQWYQDALERKHQRQITMFAIHYWIPRALGLAAVIALLIIAFKM
jgi:hypothetical protein